MNNKTKTAPGYEPGTAAGNNHLATTVKGIIPQTARQANIGKEKPRDGDAMTPMQLIDGVKAELALKRDAEALLGIVYAIPEEPEQPPSEAYAEPGPGPEPEPEPGPTPHTREQLTQWIANPPHYADDDIIMSWYTELQTLEDDPPPPTPVEPEQPTVAPYAISDHAALETVCPWLAEYVEFSRMWSPEASDNYHEAVGLWVLSTVAARRVRLAFGGGDHTGLYIALVGRTSLYAKTTTADIGREVLTRAGLSWLLAADSSTPQRFIYDLTGKLPADYGELSEKRQTQIRNQLSLPGQRGWYYDEFGQKLRSMMQASGIMEGFRTIFKKIDNFIPFFEYRTLSRGMDVIERPYLALLASMTPADMRRVAEKNSALWGDGFFARFMFVYPDGKLSTGCYPREKRVIPESLISPLRQWHDRLGFDPVAITAIVDEKTGTIAGYQSSEPRVYETEISMTNAVYDVYERTRERVRREAHTNDDSDLDGNMVHLMSMALRIAALFASLNGSNTITMPLWNVAWEFAEERRADLGAFYDYITTPPDNEADEEDKRAKLKELVFKAIRKHGARDGASLSDIARACRGVNVGLADELAMELRDERMVTLYLEEGNRALYSPLGV